MGMVEDIMNIGFGLSSESHIVKKFRTLWTLRNWHTQLSPTMNVKITDPDGNEIGLGLVGNGLHKQGLISTMRTVEQDTVRRRHTIPWGTCLGAYRVLNSPLQVATLA